MTDREVMQQALEALEASIDVPCYGGHPKQEAAAAALRAQLEQPEQEPVAWMDREGDLYRMPVIENWSPPHTLLYTAPPQQQAEPVICAWSFEDDDTGTYSSACGELWSFIDGGWQDNHVRFCHGCGGKVVEAKLKKTP